MPNLRSFASRLLIQSHRWLGIPLSLVIILWFVSGIAMMYVGGMPRLTPQDRLAHLPALRFDNVRLTPAQAAATLSDEASNPGPPVMLMVQDRPAYRFPAAFNATVFADDGSRLTTLDEDASLTVAEKFLGTQAGELRFIHTLDEPDQWTLSLRRALPLLKYEAGDDAGTELYVSPAAGEVVQVTTRRDRGLAWIATIPHWLYFTSLRESQPLWYRTVVWLSAAACLLAVLGLALAFTQWRKSRPLDLRRSIPYRGGMRWHYITGALFGVFALTWAFSGLLSMEPFEWTNAPELEVDTAALTGGPVELPQYDAVDLAALHALAAPRLIKELSFRRIHGDHHLTLRTSDAASAAALPRERGHAPYGARAQSPELLVAASTLVTRNAPFDSDVILERLAASLPGVPVLDSELLHDYDDYYYSRSGQLPLPVLRIRLGDALATWLYVETGTSQLVANVHRYSRVERWLYNGLHSLDFRFWHSKRPLWDIVMITLLLGGLATSCLGLYYGVRGLLPRRRRG